jgi:hypothetical protein
MVINMPQVTRRRGYAVAPALVPDTSPLRCYVGQVEEPDEHGVRICLIDWVLNEFRGFDVFVPWENVQSALVATDEHDMIQWFETTEKWQSWANDEDEEEYT